MKFIRGIIFSPRRKAAKQVAPTLGLNGFVNEKIKEKGFRNSDTKQTPALFLYLVTYKDFYRPKKGIQCTMLSINNQKGMMKNIVICSLLIFLTSCTSVKLKQDAGDYTQELKGEIKEINSKIYNYSYRFKDSLMNVEEVTKLYGKNNNLQLQTSYDSDRELVTEIVYNQVGFIKQYINTNPNHRYRTENQYDLKNKIVMQQGFLNDSLDYTKEFKYDKKGNVIEEKMTHQNTKLINYVEKRTIDYRNNYLTVEGFDWEGKNKGYFIKKYYNRNGNFIRIEEKRLLQEPAKYIYEYDKRGNLLKLICLAYDNRVILTWTFRNRYDKKGNIVERERFANGILTKKTVHEIRYSD